jgi:phosphoribosylformylglycinamidine synthase
MRPDYFLFSESLGRFIVTIDPAYKRAFELAVGPDAHLLGRTGGNRLRITGKNLLVDTGVSELETAYKALFRGY